MSESCAWLFLNIRIWGNNEFRLMKLKLYQKINKSIVSCCVVLRIEIVSIIQLDSEKRDIFYSDLPVLSGTVSVEVRMTRISTHHFSFYFMSASLRTNHFFSHLFVPFGFFSFSFDSALPRFFIRFYRFLFLFFFFFSLDERCTQLFAFTVR